MLGDRSLKTKKRTQQVKETGDSRYIYQNELDKACFQLDLAYGDYYNNLDKLLHNKAFNIAKNPKYDGYKKGLASLFYKFFNKILRCY